MAAQEDIIQCTKEKRQAQAKTARRPRDGDAESGLGEGWPGIARSGQGWWERLRSFKDCKPW